MQMIMWDFITSNVGIFEPRECEYPSCRQSFTPLCGTQRVCKHHSLCMFDGCNNIRPPDRSIYCNRHRGGVEVNGKRLNYSRVTKLKPVDRAYIASMIDGEGCISVEWGGRDKNIPRIHVAITNTCEKLMTYLTDIIGGGVASSHLKSDRRVGVSRRTVYQYRISAARDVLCLLKQVSKYLIVKKDRADLAIEFIECRITNKYIGFSNRELEIAHRIRFLNMRGTAYLKTHQLTN